MQVKKGSDIEYADESLPEGRDPGASFEVGDLINANWRGGFYEAMILAIDGT